MPAVTAGAPTVNAKFGTRTAVMLGDFFFAESSNMLAELANQEVRRIAQKDRSLDALREAPFIAICKWRDGLSCWSLPSDAVPEQSVGLCL